MEEEREWERAAWTGLWTAAALLVVGWLWAALRGEFTRGTCVWICISSSAIWLSERRRLRAMPFSRLMARRDAGECCPVLAPKLKSSRMPLSCLGDGLPLGGGGRTMVEEDVGEGISRVGF